MKLTSSSLRGRALAGTLTISSILLTSACSPSYRQSDKLAQVDGPDSTTGTIITTGGGGGPSPSPSPTVSPSPTPSPSPSPTPSPTPTPGQLLTFHPSADAYVSDASAATNFGTASAMTISEGAAGVNN